MEQKPEKKQPDLLGRPLYAYDLPPEVLNSLALKADANPQAQESTETTGDSDRSTNPNPTQDSSLRSCVLCSLTFKTVDEQRNHVRADWHQYNLKQKLRGLCPVTEAEFERLIGDLDESISGSESSGSEEDEDETSRKETTLSALLKKQATLAERSRSNAKEGDDDEDLSKKKRGGKAPLLWFGSPVLPENTFFGLYTALFTPEELHKEDEIVEAIKKRQLAPISMPKPGKDGAPAPSAYKGPHVFLCMIGGGHFAAMVVSLAPRQTKHASSGPLSREATVLAHKTFHRYTTRRKQGGSQSANDAAKGAAHSAGSSLRRYNEQALVEDVRDLLKDWKALIDSSDLLFLRATGVTNRRTLFGPYEGQVLKANDPRIRGFPFSTRRATQNELMRSFIELTRLKVRVIDPAIEAAASETATKPATPTKSTKPAPPKLSEEDETALLHTNQLQALIRRSKLPAVLSYLQTNGLPPDFRFFPPDQNHHAPTPLHLAAAQNAPPLVTGLLTRGGADPGATNADGKTPFELAGDRGTRDAFRVARAELGEAAWDWEAARVPAALARAEAERRAERERKEGEAREEARRRAEEERLRREGPAVGDTARARGPPRALQMTAQEQWDKSTRGFTAEQKTGLSRELRARAAEERMRRMQAEGAGK